MTKDYTPLNKMIQSRRKEALDKLIMSLIGGLNGRRPFFDYLKKNAEIIIEAGGSEEEVTSFIKAEHDFWAGFLKEELERYDQMRTDQSGSKRVYAFVHFEFDDLFRYFDDPARYFGIDIHEQLSEEKHDYFSVTFGKAIEEKRKIPWTILPVSFLRFIFLIYELFSVQLIKFLFFPRKTPIYDEGKALDFWKAALFLGISVNILMGIFLYRTVVHTQLPITSIILLCLLQCFLFPISLRTVIQLLRTIIALRYSLRNKVAPIKTWSHVRKYFATVMKEADHFQKENFYLMLREMRENFLITDNEFRHFSSLDISQMPKNETACYHIRRFMNKFYHIKIADPSGPMLWSELESLSILVFSLDEKFYYTFYELTDTSCGKNILGQLRDSYADEWENLIVSLSAELSFEQDKILRAGVFQKSMFSGKIVSEIERWANMRMQCLYHTLESIKNIKSVYERIARSEFHDASEEHIRRMVMEKIQIMLLHDRYPEYGCNDKQKKDIDDYLRQNPLIELHWPKDLLHPSKYGSFANVLPSIRGDFLIKLDSDHHADIEEISYIPYLFRIFKRNSKCDAIGFRLYVFNEKYNLVTHLSALSNNAWWIHDLRVKSLVGGGGVYGKLMIRTKALLEKEFIQPDSVAEDMLAMTRLSINNSEIQFSELVEIGHGEDISYYGLKRKLGRYPIGAVESAATKLYREMLISPQVSLHRKLESLFMLSFYPLQAIVVLAHFLVLSAWAIGIDIFSFLLFPAVLLSFAIITLTDGLYVWVHMYEREGIIRGTKRYFITLLPMVFFHGGYFYHYLEQLIKGLKGYAKFNISEKKYQLLQKRWNEHYQKNKFSFNLGSLGVGLFVWGAIVQRHSLYEVAAILPFVFSSLIWGFSILFFVRREERILWGLDFLGEAVFIFVRSFYDLLTSPFINSRRLNRETA